MKVKFEGKKGSQRQKKGKAFDNLTMPLEKHFELYYSACAYL